MDLAAIIIAQYRAALAMLRQSVERCPAEIWDAGSDGARSWHIAYHALFYVHLYLHESLASFRPWGGHREGYEFFGRLPWPPHDPVLIGEPYTPAEVLGFLERCEAEVLARVPQLALDARSGFDWLPMTRLELHIYSIRHLQQHTAELMGRLGERAGIELGWVGSLPAEQR